MSAPRAGSFDVRGFQAQLKARALGRAFEWHPFIGSTNDRARDWAREGAPHGALVLADEQWAGRGRHGRAWRSAAERHDHVDLAAYKIGGHCGQLIIVTLGKAVFDRNVLPLDIA